uniref:Uncharacterized protein n=1 Tax=Anopheles culicifacies TaxID=139723 RepID=A0A182MC72_9DIPT
MWGYSTVSSYYRRLGQKADTAPSTGFSIFLCAVCVPPFSSTPCTAIGSLHGRIGMLITAIAAGRFPFQSGGNVRYGQNHDADKRIVAPRWVFALALNRNCNVRNRVGKCVCVLPAR